MSATPLTAPIQEESALRHALGRLRGDPAYQSFTLLRIGFAVLPAVMGADKFANVLVNWERYLAPWMAHLSPLSKLHTMHVVGVIEIVAGIAVDHCLDIDGGADVVRYLFCAAVDDGAVRVPRLENRLDS